MADHNEYEDAYSDDGFWDKLKHYAKIAGKEVVEKALLLYYAGNEEDAPAWAGMKTCFETRRRSWRTYSAF